MNAKHTPGPWTYRDGNRTTYTVTPENGPVRIVAEIPDPRFDDYGIEECEANANLIAAAPELLEALEHAENALSRAGFCEDGLALKVARAAIAKAKGGQP